MQPCEEESFILMYYQGDKHCNCIHMYLSCSAQGFDQMIEAAHSGFPVDMAQVPAAPGSEDNFEMVTGADCADPDKPVGDREEMYQKLEQELIQMIRVRESRLKLISFDQFKFC